MTVEPGPDNDPDVITISIRGTCPRCKQPFTRIQYEYLQTTLPRSWAMVKLLCGECRDMDVKERGH